MSIRAIQILIFYILFQPLIAQVDYDSQIQPIFNLKCTQCHGNSAGLNLSSYENTMTGSNNGDVISPYDHTSSELWIRVNSGQMPPGNNDLTDSQADFIAQWIDEGALLEVLDCDPGLVCEESITCCDGLLYQTTCCDANCDEPISECEAILAGDLNDDGILNVLDIVLMVNMALDGAYEEVADMNGDGVINILDIVTLINTILS